MKGTPPSSRSPLGVPMREDRPAARTTSVPGSGASLAMMNLEELGGDADGHFARRLATDVEAEGALDPIEVRVGATLRREAPADAMPLGLAANEADEVGGLGE